MLSNRITFTKPKLDGLKPEDTAYVLIDERYAARRHGTLSVRVAPSGDKTFRVQYRVKDPATGKLKQTKKALGTWDVLRRDHTVDNIRDLASAHVRDAQSSGLTVAEAEARRLAELQAAEAAEKAVTAAQRGIADWGAEYVAGRMSGDIQTPHADGCAGLQLALDRAVGVWGDRPVTELTVDDGNALLKHVVEVSKNARYNNGALRSRGKYPGYEQARKTKRLLTPLLKYIRRRLPTVADGIFEEWRGKTNGPRRAVMTKSERLAFFEGLLEFEKPQTGKTGRLQGDAQDTADILRIMYLCAARKSDAVQPQWRDIDFEKATWTRPEHKVKQGVNQTQKLSPLVLGIFEKVRARRIAAGVGVGRDDYVFPSTTTTGKPYRTSVTSGFETVMADINANKTAEEKITPHVLRASRITEWKDEHGWSYEKISRMMGNSVGVIERIYHRPRDEMDEEVHGDFEVDSDASLPI